MKDRMFFDTNILIYAYDKSEPEKRKICKKLVKEVFEGEKRGIVSSQILNEFFVVLTEKVEKPLSLENAGMIIRGMLNSRNWIKLTYGIPTVRKAIEMVKRRRIPFWDALIAVTILENGFSKIYTENLKDFGKIPELEVINPLI